MSSSHRGPDERLRGFLSVGCFLDAFSDEERRAIAASVVAGERSEEDVFAEFGERVAAALWPRFERLHSEAWAAPPADALRFPVGASVLVRSGGAWCVWALCALVADGGCYRLPARVTAHWHREEDWPPAFLAPYQLRLAGVASDEDALLFAPVDSDSFLRAPSKTVPPVGWTDPALLLGYCDWEGRKAAEWRRTGMSGLHFSCLRGDVEAVRTLLRRPLAENQPSAQENLFRDSPLHACVQAESLECAMLLLAAGADPCARNAVGRSVLELAQEHVGGLRCEWAHAALLQLLARFLEAVGEGEEAPPEGEPPAEPLPPPDQLYL